MQAVGRNTDFVTAPREYRNRPYSPAFDTPRSVPLCDVIYLIDEDVRIREEISACFSALGMKVIAFSSATEYLDFKGKESAACLILDTHLPDISGFELQRRLVEKANPPAIFISGQCDIASTVRAMKAGAVEFLTKPVDLHALVSAVQEAFVQDRKQRRKKAELAELQERFSLLTPRERDVLPLVVGGLLNKQAASLLGISEVTLQIHRSQVMRKTRAESLAELVRMAVKLRIPYWRECPSGQNDQPKPTLSALQSSFAALARVQSDEDSGSGNYSRKLSPRRAVLARCSEGSHPPGHPTDWSWYCLDRCATWDELSPIALCLHEVSPREPGRPEDGLDITPRLIQTHNRQPSLRSLLSKLKRDFSLVHKPFQGETYVHRYRFTRISEGPSLHRPHSGHRRLLS